jgi:hypothetical protein
LVHLAGKKIFLFGICLSLYSRPSTPIEDVLQNRYGDKWVDTMKSKQDNLNKKQNETAVIKSIIYILMFLFSFG